MTKTTLKQLLDIQKGHNFRELGGYATKDGLKIKSHKLLRTGHLGNLDRHDLQLLSHYPVKYDIDFRTTREVTQTPDKVPAGTLYDFNPVFSEDLTNSSKGVGEVETWAQDDPRFGFDHMLYAYEDMVEGKPAQNAYRHFFARLLSNTQPDEALLFHCTAGKDRTGFAAAVLLSALKVPQETIVQDYLMTNQVIADFVGKMLAKAQADGANANVLQSIKDIQTVHKAYLSHAFETVNKDYGSIAAYLRQAMQLAPTDLQDLRKIYLEA